MVCSLVGFEWAHQQFSVAQETAKENDLIASHGPAMPIDQKIDRFAACG
jgi:hypothetical protein